MSTVTENRVVEMRFDNQQFEKNAKESIATLGSLKEALRFGKDATRGFEELEKSANNLKLNHMSDQIDKVSDRFSALGVVGATVINRLTNAAIDFGKKAFSSMTGGLEQGFGKYSSKMEAVQVMMINSKSGLEAINEELDKLQFYTDETSYSFSQMVNAMGKFTAANIGIGDAEEMVQGIANWAATAGVNAVNAERAFDAMSKAVAKGYLEYDKSESLNMMNMFTPDARRLMLEVAASMGTIRKDGEQFYANVSSSYGKIKEVEITTEDFLTTLTKGKWATTDVLQEFLHLYNATAEELDLIDLQILEAAGLTEHFGEEAYDAAYVAKTFADAIGAVRDALSSGWSRTFENIFGNYQEAAQVWTDVANIVSTVVIDMADARNALLAGWKEIGGRERLILGIIELFRNLTLIISAVKAGFDSVFEGMDSQGLYNITRGFHELMLALRPSQETLRTIAQVFAMFFSIIKNAIPIIKTIASILGTVIKTVAILTTYLVALAAEQLILFTQSETFARIVNGLVTALKAFALIAISTASAIYNFVKSFANLPAVRKVVDDLKVGFSVAGKKIVEILGTIAVGFLKLVSGANDLTRSNLPSFFDLLNKAIEKTWNLIKSVKDFIVGLVKAIAESFTHLKSQEQAVSNATTDVKNKLSDLGDTVKSSALVTTISNLTNSFKKFFGELTAGKAVLVAAGVGIAGLVAKGLFSSGGKNAGIGGLFGAALDAGGLAKKVAIIGAAGGAIALLYKRLKGSKEAGTAESETISFFDKVAEAISNFKKAAKDGSEGISFVDRIKIAFSSLVDTVNNAVTPATNAIKKFFDGLTVGKAIMIAFGVTVAKNLLMFGGTLGAVPFLLVQVTNLLRNINGAITQWSIWGADTFGDTVVKIGQSLIYFAGAMWLIAEIPADRFNDTINAVTTFMKTLLVITSMSGGLALLGKLGNIWDFGLMLLSVSGAVALFALAMKTIESIGDPNKMIAPIIGIIAGLTVVAKILPAFSNVSIAFSASAKSIIAMIAAIIVLATSIWRLSKIPTNELLGASFAMTSVLTACSILLVGAAKFGVIGKQAAGTALAVFAVAVAFRIITDSLKAIADYGLGIQHIVDNFGGIGEVFVVLTGLFVGINALTKFFKPMAKDAALMGVALLALSASMAILSGVLVMLTKVGDYVTDKGIIYSFFSLIAIGAALGLAMKGFAGVGKEAAKASLSLILVTGAFTILAGLGIIFSLIPDIAMFGKAMAAIVVLGGMVSLMNKTASMIKPETWKPLMSMVAILATIAGSLYLLSTYGDAESMGKIALDIAGVLLAVGVAIKLATSKMPNPDLYKTLLAMVGAILVTGLALNGLKDFNSGQLVVAALSISGVLIALSAAMKVMSTFDASGSVNIGALLSFVLAIGVIGASIGAVAKNNWVQILNAAAGISMVLLALAATYKIMMGISIGTVNMVPLIALIAAIGVIGASLAAVAKNDWTSILAAAVSISAVMGVMTLIMGVLGPLTMTPFNPVPLIAMCAALAVVATSLYAVSTQPWQQILAAMLGINVTLGILTGVLAIVSGIGTGLGPGMLLGVAALDLLSVSLIAIAAAFKMLEGIQLATVGTGLLAIFGALTILLTAAAVSGIPLVSAGLVILTGAIIGLGAAAIEFGIAANLLSNAALTIANAFTILTSALVVLGTQGPYLAEGIITTFTAIGVGIGTGLASIITSFVGTLTASVGTAVKSVIEKVKSFVPDMLAAGGDLISGLKDGIYNMMPGPVKAVADTVTSLVGAVKGDGESQMSGAGGDIMQAFANGVQSQEGAINKQGSTIGEKFLNGFRDILGWHSPPGFIESFFGDLITAFANGTDTAVPSLSSDGAAMGSALGSSLESSAQPFINSLVNKVQSLWNMIRGANADAGDMADEATAYANSVYDEAAAKYEQARRAKETLEAARRTNAEGDAYDNDDISYEEAKEVSRYQTLMRNGYRYMSGDSGSAGGAGGGGSGGGGGGGAKQAAEEARELFDVWKDGGEVIQKTAERFGDAYNALGYTHPLQMGEAAVESLANKLYDVYALQYDEAELAQVTTEERLADMKELYDGFFSSVMDQVVNAGDAFGNFSVQQSESIDSWIRNLGNQSMSIDAWVNHIEQLAAKTHDYNLVEQFINWGPEQDARLRKVLLAPEGQLKELSNKLLQYNDITLETAKERARRVLAAAAYTTLDTTEKTEAEISKSAEDTAEDVENASDSATNTLEANTQRYVVANRNGAVDVVNNINKVITANGELGQSAFDAAKVTEEAYLKMEDVYLRTRDAVAEAIGTSIDLFNKFDTESEIDSEELMDTADKNLKAWETMYDGIATLADRGLNTDFIIDELITMGESAYGYVQAMLQWTQEDIDKWNVMWERSLALPTDLADRLGRDLAGSTLAASQGFIAGLGNDATYAAAKEVAFGFVDKMIDALNNPQKGTPSVGQAMTEGTAEAITKNQSVVDKAGLDMINNAVVVCEAGAETASAKIGEGLVMGLVEYLESPENQARVAQAYASLADVGNEAFEDEEEINSPSKVFARYGDFIVQGLVNGIGDSAYLVERATTSMGDSALDSMRAVVGHIADIVNGEVQVDPTIRPVVDVSGVEEGASAINSIFGGRSYSMTRGIKVQNANDSINDLMAQMGAQSAGAVVSNSGSPINMYVYAAPGQSEEEIANIVEQKLMFRFNRLGAVWN